MAGSQQFVVLQKSAGPPGTDRLKRAFKVFSTLTDADAVRLATHALGILMKTPNRDAAHAFQRALEAEGIDGAVVPESDLPKLPDGRSLHRLGISPEAFTVFDLLGRPTPIAWGDLALVAAGAVRHFEMSKTLTDRTVVRFNPIYGVSRKTVQETTHKVAADSQLVLEILLRGGATRFQIEAAQFPLNHVIDQPGLTKAEKFVELVRRICSLTPKAVLNRGARAIHSGQHPVPEYANRQMLTDEIVWLLWRGSHENDPG